MSRGGPIGNQKALKHGLYVYKAMLNGDGLDQRTALYRALRAKEQELVTALGGDPSLQERIIINDTVKHLLFAASCPAPDTLVERPAFRAPKSIARSSASVRCMQTKCARLKLVTGARVCHNDEHVKRVKRDDPTHRADDVCTRRFSRAVFSRVMLSPTEDP